MKKGGPCIEDTRLLRDCWRSLASSNQRKDRRIECGKGVKRSKEYTHVDDVDACVGQKFSYLVRFVVGKTLIFSSCCWTATRDGFCLAGWRLEFPAKILDVRI